MRDYFASGAGPVGDAAVQRLERQATGGIAGDECVKAPPQPIDLDNIADMDSF
jgi:hypothetical protein